MSEDSTIDECWACGKPYAEHLDARPEGSPAPRMPCLGLKAWYGPRSAVARASSPAARECHCKQYRLALEAIVRGVREGWQAATLGDVARIALLLGPGEERRRG